MKLHDNEYDAKTKAESSEYGSDIKTWAYLLKEQD